MKIEIYNPERNKWETVAPQETEKAQIIIGNGNIFQFKESKKEGLQVQVVTPRETYKGILSVLTDTDLADNDSAVLIGDTIYIGNIHREQR